MSYIGVDLGTTNCKVGLFSGEGEMLFLTRGAYRVYSPRPGWAEVDPREMRDVVFARVLEAAGQATDDVRAISFSSQGEGVVPLNETFEPVGNILLSYDRRADEMAAVLEARLGRRHIFSITGQLVNGTVSAAKILWLRKNRPAVRYACVGDYILSAFGGAPVIDPSLAARTMLFDATNNCWSEQLTDAIGIRRDALSEIASAGQVAFRMPDERARALGLLKGARVVVGGHDQPCALLGACGEEKDGCLYSLGTTETFVCPVDAFKEELYDAGLCCYPHVLPGRYVTLPGNYTGGILAEWFLDQFGAEERRIARETGSDAYDLLVQEMADTPSGILVLPHFTTTGSPYNDSKSVGAVVGLNLSTTRAEWIRALYEGVTLEMLLNKKLAERAGVRFMRLTASGGAAKSKKIMQLKCDVLGVPIEIPQRLEAACRGAACLAAMGTGEMLTVGKSWGPASSDVLKYEPNREYNQKYEQIYQQYIRLYPQIRRIYGR